MKKLILFSLFFCAITSFVACSKDDDSITTPDDTTVYMKNGVFSKDTVEVRINEIVTWINDDNTVHTVTGDNGEFDSGDLGPGGSYQISFSALDTINYSCKYHPSMKAVVRVLPTR